MSHWIRWIFILLPHHCLTQAMARFTRVTFRPVKNTYIRWFVKHFQVNLEEAEITDPTAYPHFQAFFTRALKPNCRPIAPGANVVISPVDGALLDCGEISGKQDFLIKGESYSLDQLLGEPLERATPTHFMSYYLSPKDYHRIHMPLSGKLHHMCAIPGDLFPVAPKFADTLPQVLIKNERLVCTFETEFGTLWVVFIGAFLVGGIVTTWHGQVFPHGKQKTSWYYENPVNFAKGDELGYFTMGSAVTVLMDAKNLQLKAALNQTPSICWGEAVGTIKAMADN